MNACDLTVVPSLTTDNFKEQYGRVVQEAIACGCLTITSDSGFLPHFFDDGFFIFKENDIPSLKSKIREVIALNKEGYAHMISKSRSYIYQYFSISAQAETILREL